MIDYREDNDEKKERSSNATALTVHLIIVEPQDWTPTWDCSKGQAAVLSPLFPAEISEF